MSVNLWWSENRRKVIETKIDFKLLKWMCFFLITQNKKKIIQEIKYFSVRWLFAWLHIMCLRKWLFASLFISFRKFERKKYENVYRSNKEKCLSLVIKIFWRFYLNILPSIRRGANVILPLSVVINFNHCHKNEKMFFRMGLVEYWCQFSSP